MEFAATHLSEPLRSGPSLALGPLVSRDYCSKGEDCQSWEGRRDGGIRAWEYQHSLTKPGQRQGTGAIVNGRREEGDRVSEYTCALEGMLGGSQASAEDGPRARRG